MNTQSNKTFAKNDSSAIPWQAVVRFLVTTVLMLGVLFISAGSLRWWEGWAYTGTTLAVLVLSRTLIIVKNPDMARERAEAGKKEDVKSWDKILMPATVFFSSYWVAIPSILLIILSFVRTALEDRTLKEELTGYREYSEHVRYRLIPGIW
jgi:protein-S-isoprenylcysteine O-methyltransferase Ste14